MGEYGRITKTDRANEWIARAEFVVAVMKSSPLIAGLAYERATNKITDLRRQFVAPRVGQTALQLAPESVNQVVDEQTNVKWLPVANAQEATVPQLHPDRPSIAA